MHSPSVETTTESKAKARERIEPAVNAARRLRQAKLDLTACRSRFSLQ
jgi:hypothetical protein